jgi:hypothetical protein
LFDADHSFIDVFVTLTTLTYAERIEPFFYTATPSVRHHVCSKLCFFSFVLEGWVGDEIA